MRLLLISWEYAPVIEGGLGRHVTKLAGRLAADGHDVHVLTRGAAAESEVRDGVRVHRVAMEPFALSMDRFMPWVAELNAKLAAAGTEILVGQGFDVIHSHDWLVAAAAEQIAAAASAPWLVTVHATEFGRHNGWVHTHPQQEIHQSERRMVRRADRVITCSEYMRGQVCRVFGVPASAVTAIPNGIDIDDLTAPGIDLPALRARYAAPDEPLVLMIGRLVYEKGFQVALEALARCAVTKLGTDAAGLGAGGASGPRWLLAGSGTAAEDLAAQAERLGLGASGRLLGRIDDDLLHALYRVADIVVVPSLYEPFGIVPLEAMACGTAVISSDAGGLREVVPADQSAGLRVPAGDVGALCDALAVLIDDPARRAELARAGAAHAAGFDWSAIAARTVEVYRRLTVHSPQASATVSSSTHRGSLS